MNFNTEFNSRRQKERVLLSLYSVQAAAAKQGKFCKSRSRQGAYVALPAKEVSWWNDKIKNYGSS